ncbi:MAG: RNA polymerase subunit sigma-24 [Planctomycetota bacterium]|nr:MAG: RNA polymerase subunit sigma-24 [Planctomycetota bacterium]
MDGVITANERSRDELAFVARLQSGDGAAFETLVREHGPRMLAVVRRFLGNDEDAQDALQDALVSVYRGIHRFEGHSQLATWLHRVASNAALMRLRSRRRTDETPIDDLLPTFIDDGHQTRATVAWSRPVEQLLERQETAELVRRAIDQLPESYRAILLLRDIEERDTEETAQLLGINAGAVKTRLHRARQALRTLLDSKMRDETP